MASRTTARAALSLGTSGHEEESRAYLQRFHGDVVCATPAHREDRLRGLV